MSCHFIVCSDEYALVIHGYYIFVNASVKKDYGNVFFFCHIYYIDCCIVRACIHNIYDKSFCTFGDGCLNLFGLCCLVAVGIVVVVVYAGVVEHFVHGTSHT